MDMTVNGVSYHIEVFNETNTRTLVLLHGFTGSTKTWHTVIQKMSPYKIVLVDLLGHGQTGSPSDPARYSMEQQIIDLDALFDQLQLPAITLVGYSMGGRTALAYACAHPERLKSLILESASPGLDSEQERLDRMRRDAVLADRIEAEGIVKFVDRWENIPLFETQKQLPENIRVAVRSERLAQTPFGLANSLRGMGTGSQAPYWACLADLSMPVLLVTGTLDFKFDRIAQDMMERLPNGCHEKVEAGHAIHVEKPAEFATIVEKYLSFNQ